MKTTMLETWSHSICFMIGLWAFMLLGLCVLLSTGRAQADDNDAFARNRQLGRGVNIHKGEMQSRARYTSFVARTAERLGWSWAYWQFDSDFVVYDIPKDQWVEPIHRALVPETKTNALGDFEEHSEVGRTQIPGAAAYDPDQRHYRLTGSGENIWGQSDAFHFLWRKVEGDLSLAAKIDWIGAGKNAHRKACLMVRQGLDPEAPYADVAVHGDGLISRQYRRWPIYLLEFRTHRPDENLADETRRIPARAGHHGLRLCRLVPPSLA